MFNSCKERHFLTKAPSFAPMKSLALWMMMLWLVWPGATACRNAVTPPKAATHKPVNPAVSVEEMSAHIKDGDVVLRAGIDITSNMLRQLNLRDKRFSHCGIAFHEQGRVWVYHSIGSESDPDQPIKRELLSRYWDTTNNMTVGFVRFDVGPKDIQTLHHTVDSFYRRQIPFDMQFDLHTDERMYCTEMVAKALKQSMPYLSLYPTDTLNRQYWSVDNITGSASVQIMATLPLK